MSARFPTALLLCVLAPASALENGLRLPPMGWSSWYGFTDNINEAMLRAMADGMVSSGLHAAGYEHIWIDDGWAMPRDNKTGGCGEFGPVPGTKDSCKVQVEKSLFPSGMANLSAYIHQKSLKFGIYTSKGPLTCLGTQRTQPPRPGSCGYEQIDADVYVKEWDVDQVKDDGCGGCPQHEPFAAMRDALNKTGKPVFYAIHSQTAPGSPNGTVANMWRTGGDLSGSNFAMWTNRLDLATTASQRALAGPGAFPNPDFLEVGYSPRNPKGRPNVQSPLEMRSMFTMWAALPGPLILSADLRPGAPCGGIDAESLETLTNAEVIAVNQDALALPMSLVSRSHGLEVWKKKLTGGKLALILFYRNDTSAAAATSTPHAGLAVSMGSCSTNGGLEFDLSGGAIKLKPGSDGASSLCLGAVGTCKCSNPSSPRIGLLNCNISDTTQTWTLDPKTGQLNNDAKHDLNTGPVCKGDAGNSMLLYPVQSHANEKYSHNAVTGAIQQGGRCLVLTGGAPAPTTPPRTITVTWEQLGWATQSKVSVRDLWAKKELGEQTKSFSALVRKHEALIYVMTPN